MGYLFTSESVSEGHPDKVADQISDAILDNMLAFDPNAKVACETLVTTGQVVIAGEVKTNTYVDVQQIARDTINKIGYTKSEYMFDGNSCGVLSALHEQSQDITRGVERADEMNQGAGDQGMMFGYACTETDNYMPLPLYLAHAIVRELSLIRKENEQPQNFPVMTYLRPDAKSQVTVEYDDKGVARRIQTIVVSTQHNPMFESTIDNDSMIEKQTLDIIREDVKNIVLERVKEKMSDRIKCLFDDKLILLVNPTGRFVVGGPHGDAGVTGRKIIVDTYGGRAAHGGGAFSGKDPSKVDRSAAYMARYIAKNMVAAGVSDEMLVQISYAIGVALPVNVYVNTYGKSNVTFTDDEIALMIMSIFDLRPRAIEKHLKLREPIYSETAAYGHFGRELRIVEKRFDTRDGNSITKQVELFTWEKLDMVKTIRKEFADRFINKKD